MSNTNVGICVTLLILTPFGCKTFGGDSQTSDLEEEAVVDITGTYNLVSIDGNPIPYAPAHLNRRQPTVAKGDLTLRDTGAFASTMAYSNDAGQTMTRTFAGTYREDGDRYLLSWQGAGRTAVTIDGETLTMNNEGMLFVYEKGDSER